VKYLPPDIRELLQVPEFLRMMKTAPWLPQNLRQGDPWRLWALKNDGVWVTLEYPTYADAWRVLVKAVRAPERFQDAAIVNKRRMTAPPDGLERALRRAGFTGPWCPRCRRPTYFGAFKPTHHALRLMPVLSEDEPFRCYYCGIRRVATKGVV